MAEIKVKFRTAAIGGFNRQDVVAYIQENANEHARQLNALRAELEEAKEQLGILKGEKARADELSACIAELTERADLVPELQAEVEKLCEENESLHQKAEAYDVLKASVADIEIDARSRAALIIQEAETQAEEIRTAGSAEADAIRAAAEEEVSIKLAQADSIIAYAKEESARVDASTSGALGSAISLLTSLRSKFLEGRENNDE